MARRKRKAIRKDEYLAAALSMTLSYEERTALRRARVPAKSILAMFSPDHLVLHCWGGSDLWWNLTPTLRETHKEKSKMDTKRAAKVKRLVAKLARPAPGKPAGAFSRRATKTLRPKRKMASRPLKTPFAARRFPKRDRCWTATPPRDVNHE